MRHFAFGLAAAIAAAALLATAAPARAAGDEELIVVTGTRYADRYEDTKIPAISVRRRADFAVARVLLESDSRDAAQRRSELQTALTEMDRGSRGGPITLALIEDGPEGDAGETRLRPFTLAQAMALVGSGSRPDTSRVTVQLRVAVTQAETQDSIKKRFNDFIAGVPRPGRVTVAQIGGDLVINNPAQYRDTVIAAIMADARKAVTAAGPNQAFSIEGLEGRIAWRPAGDLDLLLYIPYELTIEPAE